MPKSYNLKTSAEWKRIKEMIERRISNAFVPFSITLDVYREKRSRPQLDRYWAMINDIKISLNDYGNNLDQEMVSDMMKSMFHYDVVMLPDGTRRKTLKSVSDKSETDKQQMSTFMDQITVWCAEMNIELREKLD